MFFHKWVYNMPTCNLQKYIITEYNVFLYNVFNHGTYVDRVPISEKKKTTEKSH